MLPILIIGATPEERTRMAQKMAAAELKVPADRLANHADYFEINPEPSITIQKVRQLIHSLSQKPYQGEKVVAVINQVNLATTESQNALLKTLEEPPRFATIILTAQSESNLLPTVVSRCRALRLADINTKSEKQIADLTNSLLSAKRAELLKKLEELNLPRPELIILLSQLIRTAEGKLRQEKGDRQLKISHLLQLLEKAKSQVESNANIRLVLISLLLNL